MDVKDFISSGIIESYLLGTATEQEVSMVNDMKEKYSDVLEEIIRVEEAMIAVAESGRPALNPKIKKNILGSLQSKEKLVSNSKPGAQLVSINDSKIRYYKYAIAASVSLFIISSVLNILFFARSAKMNSELAKLSKENIQLATEMKAQNISMKEMNDEFAMLMDPASNGVVMKGLDISPTASAKVFWNSNSSEVYLMISQLPPPPADKQYQLWAIVDGKPVDAGVFDVNVNSKLQKMKNISSPQAFAVTLENKGGSPVPTMEAMYLIGNV